jgi:hypothetical protein
MPAVEAEQSISFEYKTLLSFERVTFTSVRVTFEKGFWWWKKTYTATFERGFDGDWYRVGSGIHATLGVGRCLERPHARTGERVMTAKEVGEAMRRSLLIGPDVQHFVHDEVFPKEVKTINPRAYRVSGEEYEALRKRLQASGPDFQSLPRQMGPTRARLPMMGPPPTRDQVYGMIRAAVIAPHLKEEVITLPLESFFRPDGTQVVRVNDTIQVVLDTHNKRNAHVVATDIATRQVTVRYQE